MQQYSKKVKILWCLIVGMHMALFLNGQNRENGIPPSIPLENLVMEQWTTEEGLISNNLTSVFYAQSGAIWITSFNGIMLFDGNTFKLFDKEYIPEIKTNAFYDVHQPDSATLYFASQSSGVLQLKNGEFSTPLATQNMARSVRKIITDSKGNSWVGSNNAGLIKITDGKATEIKHPSIAQVIISDIIETADGTIWVATNGTGVLGIRGESFIHYTTENGLNDNTVNDLFVDAKGRLWIGSFYGINVLDGDSIYDLPEFKEYEINEIISDDYNNVWLGTEQGLIRYNEDAGTLEALKEANGLPAGQVSDLVFDKEGNLWITTKKAGLLRFNPGKFINYSKQNGLSSSKVNYVFEHESSFYIGSDDGNISVIDSNKNITPFPLKTNFKSRGVRDIQIDKKGRVYIASYNGLLIKDTDGTEKMWNSASGLGSDMVRLCYLDSKENIWVGTRTNGITLLRQDTIAKQYSIANGLSSNYILSVEEDSIGQIWVGTHSGGLDVIKKDGSIQNYVPKVGKEGFLIFNLTFDPHYKLIWLATNIGLHYFKDGEIKKVKIPKSFKVETLFDVVIDREQGLWLSSNVGVIQVENRNIEAYLSQKALAVNVNIYDDKDGMLINECTAATRSTLDSKGRLWVPTLEGASIIEPSNINKNTYVPPVSITTFITDDSTYVINAAKEYLEVNPGNVRFKINFTAYSFASPKKVRFRYKLENIDKVWKEVTNIRTVDYTSLPPGNYQFKVFGSNNDGVWNEVPAEVNIRILPFFYQTKLFYVLVILGIAALVFLFFRLRMKRVEKVNAELLKLNEELDRFVYSASHDLRAPLTSILGLVEIARLDPSAESKDKSIAMIGESVLKLDGFIKDIIDYSRNKRSEIEKEEVQFDHIIAEIYEEFKYLDKEHVIEKRSEIALNAPFLSDPRRISVILKNLIANAIKYHYPKEDEVAFIKVVVKEVGKGIQVEVEDNGKGIQKTHLENIFKMFYRASEDSKGSGLGLYIVSETVSKLSGTIKVESTFGKGTKFFLFFPR